mmetsp:Transcript_12344/g.37047  ORF Transcript_12344/g.37047 Transcript_12344/m.37047 type:complete len:286 (-) Transcript_12344:2391-3248(-)
MSDGLQIDEVVKLTLAVLPECGKWLTVRASRKGDTKSSGGGGNRQSSGGGGNRQSRHAGQGNAGRSGADSPSRQAIVCHHCGEPGHIRPKCPKRDQPPVAPSSNKLHARPVESSRVPSPVLPVPALAGAAPDGVVPPLRGVDVAVGIPTPVGVSTQWDVAAPSDTVVRRGDVAPPPVNPGAGLRQRVSECPRLPVAVHHRGVMHHLEALLDTGSNVNMIPQRVLTSLGSAVAEVRQVSIPCHLSSGQVTATAEVDLQIEIKLRVGYPSHHGFPFRVLSSPTRLRI